MAAGLGFKTFTTGEVLSASDVNGYLMQGVLVFASAAARNAAITSPQEGQFAYTKDTNGLWYYDGATWVASGATGDIEGVSVTSPITGGGTSGTVTIGIDSTAVVPSQTGNSGKYLTTNGTSSSWANVSGGGMTLLSTTTMSGSTTTVSSISQSYKKLVVYVRDFYPSGSTAQMSMYFNGFNSSSNYFGTQWGARGSTAFNGQGLSNNSGFDLTAGFSNYLYNNNTDNFLVVTIEDYANTTTKKPVSWQINAPNDSATIVNAMGIGHSVNVNDSAISSISFNTNSGTWTNGSILIYGVS